MNFSYSEGSGSASRSAQILSSSSRSVVGLATTTSCSPESSQTRSSCFPRCQPIATKRGRSPEALLALWERVEKANPRVSNDRILSYVLQRSPEIRAAFRDLLSRGWSRSGARAQLYGDLCREARIRRMNIPPSYIGSYPTPNEETANAYIGSLAPAFADYARASRHSDAATLWAEQRRLKPKLRHSTRDILCEPYCTRRKADASSGGFHSLWRTADRLFERDPELCQT